MIRTFLIAATALMLALAGGIAVAAQNSSAQNSLDYEDAYGMVDDNSDGVVSQAEFTEYFTTTNYFIGWDVNGDGQLSTDEVASGLDANDDGVIDSNELEVVLFTVYDANHDKNIEQDEWEKFPSYNEQPLATPNIEEYNEPPIASGDKK